MLLVFLSSIYRCDGLKLKVQITVLVCQELISYADSNF